jgi:hypothetical protein
MCNAAVYLLVACLLHDSPNRENEKQRRHDLYTSFCFSLVAALFSIPYRLPAAVVVEDILAGSVEHGKYVENPLCHLAAKYSIRICVYEFASRHENSIFVSRLQQ